MKKPILNIFTILFFFYFSAMFAETYHVRVDGNDANSGLSKKDAWKSIDRGQPTFLLKPCKAGDTVLRILKGNQLPNSGKVRIGKVEISYTGRTLQSLTGCLNVPNAPKGAKVWSATYTPAGAGDEIVVHKGVYHLAFSSKVERDNRGFAVAMFFNGGKSKAPLRIVGDGLPVVDGEEENGVASISIQGDNIEISGFNIRRGGIIAKNARNIKILNCRVHEGKNGINASAIRNAEIAGNMIYDMVGAWTSHGIVLSHCAKVDVHNNTIVSNAYAVKVASCRKIKVRNNLIAWCRSGIINDGTSSANLAISDNNIWWVGHGIWLQRDDQNNVKKKRYKNCAPGKGDFSADPLITQWNPGKPNFLSPLTSSPCVKNGKVVVGAGDAVSAFPTVTKTIELFNPSFEAGFSGWFIDSWVPFFPGQAGWKIVKEKGCEGEKCLELFDFPEKGKRIAIKAQSLSFRYNRGKTLKITFMAKAELANARITVGIIVPSWQNKSGLSKHVKLSKEWKTYSVEVKPLTRFPDYARVVFSTQSGTRCWIDAVSVKELNSSERNSVSAPSAAVAALPKLELVVAPSPGMLFAPNIPLTGKIINRTGGTATGTLNWTLETPLRAKAAAGKVDFNASGYSTPFSLDFPKELLGIFLLKYDFIVGGKSISEGKLRFSIGTSAAKSRKRSFFAATPSFLNSFPGELLDKQVASISTLGLGTLHLYMGYKRINELMYNSQMNEILNVSEKYGINWMFTPSDAAALTGKATWAPAPGNVGQNAIEVKRNDLKGERCSESQLKAWKIAVGMLLEKYKGRIKFYEILNEPNTFLNGAEYKKVLMRTSQLIRRITPKAAIIAGSVVNATRKELWKATMSTPPGTFDMFSYHPYRFGLQNPERKNESFRRDILNCKADLVKNGHKPAIWLTEEGMGPGLNETRCIGFRLSFSGYPRLAEFQQGEILQALYGLRMYLTALGEGCVGYSYHTLQNMITDSLMSPMLILKSIHTMNSLLGDAVPLGRLNMGNKFVCYLFKKANGTVVAVVWMKDAEYGKSVVAKFADNNLVAAYDAFGMKLKLNSRRKTDKITRMTLDRSAAYLIFKKSIEPNSVRKTLKKAFKNLQSIPGSQPQSE